MTSSENLASLDSWAFRPTFADSWLSEAWARDTETLTKALQKTFSATGTPNTSVVSETLTSDLISSQFVTPEMPTVSNVSGSDPESAHPKRQRSAIPGPAPGKISKRKSRASKRTQTTFITADPANFRQMVQQVTGVRFGNAQVPVAPILKPEPQRPGGRLPGVGGHGGGCLPTLDTSAFLLDHHQQQVVMGSNSGPGAGPVVGPGTLPYLPSTVGEGANSVLEFDTFSSFPTLESWKVM